MRYYMRVTTIRNWRGPYSVKNRSISSAALNELMTKGGKVAGSILSEVHFTRVYAWCAGRSKPNAVNTALLHKLSRGRVPAHGWTTLE